MMSPDIPGKNEIWTLLHIQKQTMNVGLYATHKKTWNVVLCTALTRNRAAGCYPQEDFLNFGPTREPEA